MSYNKFHLLHRYIHFADNEQDCKNDPIYKIRYVSDYIRTKWGKYYSPGQKLTIDESMIKFQGRCKFLQYIQNKPVKWGIKAFLLCDSSNYYCLDLNLYYGKVKPNGNNTNNFSPTERVVINLIEPYLGKGKILYCDNFFTSMKLQKFLISNKTGLIGTWRRNRIPAVNTIPIPEKKCFMSYLWKDTKDLIITIYNDKKIVYIMNSVQPVNPYLKYDKFTQNYKIIPNIVHDYNNFSHGVDFNNKRSYNNRFPHRSNKWTKNTFFHMVQVCIQNSYILYRKKQKMTYRKFYEDIIISLVNQRSLKYNIPRKHNIHYIDEIRKIQRRCRV